MGQVVIGEAVWAGFRLTGRRPVAFAVWIGLFILLGVAPVVLVFGALGPEYIDLFKSSAEAGPDSASLQAAALQMQGLQALSLIASLVLYAILFAAVFRAELEPQNSRYGYLRLGADEVRQGVWIVVLYIGLIVVAVIAMFLVVAVAAATAVASAGAGVVAGVLGLFACAAGFVWLTARLSMVLPMTFAEKALKFGEAWALTRGSGWRLSLLVLIQVMIFVGLSVLVLAIIGAVAAAFIASAGQAANLTNYFNKPGEALVRDLSPWVIAYALISAVISTLVTVVGAAPWAVIYRQLAGDRQKTEDVFT